MHSAESHLRMQQTIHLYVHGRDGDTKERLSHILQQFIARDYS